MGKVSIIVPVYNGENVLKRCVDSLLKQDADDFEVILVNDGSRDGSQAIAEAYAEKDPRVRAVYKENGGVSSARNRGLEEATGEYIRFVDVDDWLPMESTKLLVREMESSGADLAIGDFYRVVDENVSQKGSIDKPGVMDRRQYADQMMRTPADLYYGVLWNKIYRKEIIDRYEVRMDEHISYSEDMIFNLEYLIHAETISVLKAPVYYYVRTKGSLVEQNMNLNSAVRMKKSVIGYYNEFYKSVFDTRSYQERLPVIYGYLLSFSTDALSIPFAPGTRKLGEDQDAEIRFSAETGSPLVLGNYLGMRLMGRYMNTIAVKHALDIGEVKLMYALWKLGKPSSMSEVCSVSGIGQIAANLSAARLLASGMICRKGREEGKPGERFVLSSEKMEEEFRQMEADYEKICFEGMNGEEKALCTEIFTRVNANIRRHIISDD